MKISYDKIINYMKDLERPIMENKQYIFAGLATSIVLKHFITIRSLKKKIRKNNEHIGALFECVEHLSNYIKTHQDHEEQIYTELNTIEQTLLYSNSYDAALDNLDTIIHDGNKRINDINSYGYSDQKEWKKYLLEMDFTNGFKTIRDDIKSLKENM